MTARKAFISLLRLKIIQSTKAIVIHVLNSKDEITESTWMYLIVIIWGLFLSRDFCSLCMDYRGKKLLDKIREGSSIERAKKGLSIKSLSSEKYAFVPCQRYENWHALPSIENWKQNGLKDAIFRWFKMHDVNDFEQTIIYLVVRETGTISPWLNFH